jgi:hypothetical protein
MSLSINEVTGADKLLDARGMMIPFEQRLRTNGQIIDAPSDSSRVNASSLSSSTEQERKKTDKRNRFARL